ncbi:anti-sigma factor domain-containing protein [Clostridium omnivorum]|uniref:RsgI N-terminal anti-sigma domain-containing protein n=1 Tax=Clostridium omnivorum TaxID=1604902 RepID=A0ABQ5N722_9CLOT|nr:anti-sigma factor domain-containing protein [Clostridium sp. E14]GLC30921.1 hypothetical protein bsdE14_23310 [Clostridium sp. E14]
MLKTGLVLSINKKKANMVTPSGEFVKVRIKDTIPKVGETFSGELAKDFTIPKLPIVAASLAFMLLFSGTAFAYYTPTSSVIVEINPSIMLKLNMFNRIIDSSPLNDDGETVLKEIKLKNKSVNEGLETIVDEAKKENFINENYVKSDKAVTLYIDSKNDKDLNLDSFEKFMGESGVKLMINSNGKELKSTVKNASTENSKNNNSSSKQNSENKQNSDDKQNKNNSSVGNSINNNANNKKDSTDNQNSSSKNSSSVSNGKSNGNNGGEKSEDKKNADTEKKIDSTSISNGNNNSNASNKSSDHSNNGKNKNNKVKDKN